jgi:hypothetical protein
MRLRATVLADFSRVDLEQAVAFMERIQARLEALDEGGIQVQARRKR